MPDDTIALGFITTKSDAVLLRIVSGKSNDYIEMEIVSKIYYLIYMVFLKNNRQRYTVDSGDDFRSIGPNLSRYILK